MPLIRRSTVVALAAAALVTSPAVGGAAHAAAGSYTCFGGTVTGGHISANPCDGWGGVNVLVTLRFGANAGTYRCQSAFSWNGFLGADGCRREPAS
ncbi:hypothetical protein [Nonomuraea typhae]|uniref:hypothetical protein n=1 Tax=Nonomuraea typhae TaxID=2603600 RepID=UPI0012F97F68|nr:hypothetical protein [Nonomuraea typhae]